MSLVKSAGICVNVGLHYAYAIEINWDISSPVSRHEI